MRNPGSLPEGGGHISRDRRQQWPERHLEATRTCSGPSTAARGCEEGAEWTGFCFSSNLNKEIFLSKVLLYERNESRSRYYTQTFISC